MMKPIEEMSATTERNTGPMSRKSKKNRCDARTEFCSGELIARYGVNGSEKEGKTFLLCGACMVILRRQGAKMKQQ